MEVVGAVASITSLIQLTAAVSGLVHTYIGGVNRADKDRQELLNELEALRCIVGCLQKEVKENWEGSSPALRQLCTKEGMLQGYALNCALQLEALKARFKPNNRLRDRLIWPLKVGETKEYLEKIERFKSTVNMALGLDNRAALRTVEANTKSTNLLVQEYRAETQAMINLAIQNVGLPEDASASTRRKAILNWIYSGDFNAKHYEIQHRRQKGTGEWLLRDPEFVKWVEGKLKSRLLWGHGIPGAGKTFLSSTVIDHLGNTSAAKRGLGYVYFDYKDQGRQTPIEVISSLIRQLASQIQDIPATLEEVYKKSETGGKRPTLDELYNILTNITRLFDQAFFVFDALDECDPEKQRRELLPLFQRMGMSGINIFLTSRPHPRDINDSLQDAEKIELAAQKEDITIYIRERIAENPRARDLIHQGNYSGKIISKLEACANGMFLLVHLHISYLCQQTTIKQILDALEKLETTSAGEISLYPTYDSAIDRITSQHAPETELAIKTLTWLVKAKRVLQLDEIREAVSVIPERYEMDEMDLPDQRTLLEVCGGLVVTDDQTGSIRLAHYTVQEYLLERRFSFLESDAKVAIACLTYLSFDSFSTYDNSTKKEEILKRHPFFKYSSEMVVFHMRSCEQRSTTEPFLHFLKESNNVDYFNEIRSKTSSYGYQHAGRSPLHIASDAGHLEVVKRLIEMGGDALISDSQSRTPLHVAASEGQEAVVDYLLQVRYGWKPWVANIKGYFGYTALHEAASRGHERVVELLLRKSLYPPWIGNIHRLVDDAKSTTLHLAAQNGREAVVKLLLDKGADVNAIDDSKWTALHNAARIGHEAVVKLLLDKGADVKAIENLKDTALHKAAYYGSEVVAKLLLDKGADVNAINASKGTALHNAARNGHEAVVKLLLDKGADVNAINGSKWTALHNAARIGHEAVVKLLLDKGADVNAINGSKETALHKAALQGREAVVKLLLDKGADVNAIDDSKWTALQNAAYRGHEAVVKLLLDKGADVNAIDNLKETALQNAAYGGHEAVVKLLLDKGADVNAINGSKETALHIAACNGYEAVVKLLLDKGADVNAIDDSEKNALDKAILGKSEASWGRDRYEMVIRLLLENGARRSAATPKSKPLSISRLFRKGKPKRKIV